MAQNFETLHKAAEKAGDSSPCAPIALAILLDMSYEKVVQELRSMGRQKSTGTYDLLLGVLVGLHGLTLRDVTKGFRAAGVKTPITWAKSTMPKRGKRYLVFTSGHVFVGSLGKVHDWTEGRKHHIRHVYEVIRK